MDGLSGLFAAEAVALRCWLLLAALALDATIGDPDWLWRRLPHPVVLCGRLIARFDHGLNREAAGAAWRRLYGVMAVVPLVGLAAGLGLGLMAAAGVLAPAGWGIEAAFVAVLLAQRSLLEHVGRVADGLDDGLEAGRRAVSQIVGRDPAVLDEAGVARAAIESAAENYSDGVVAPAVWYLALGLPGILAYKAVNTADSMIGHRDDRHRAFGWAAARADDVANLIPARLTALLIVLAAITPGPWSARRALRTAFRDARHHRSPNAGWPEAAMAGALGLKLGGPRAYGTEAVDGVWLGDGRTDATADDIDRALRLAVRGGVLFLLAVIGLAGLLGGWIG